MAIQLTARGAASGAMRRVIGRVTRVPVSDERKADHIRVVTRSHPATEPLSGYATVLHEGQPHASVVEGLSGFKSLEFLKDRYIAVVEPRTAFVRALYRPDSEHNALFATDRCNSNCLMCSQPPKDIDDSGNAVELLKIIDLIEQQPANLGITGGEPTLLKEGLIEVVSRLNERFPLTSLVMLSNGRMYAFEDFVHEMACAASANFLTTIPLYADNAAQHDYVVQASGAFDQTIQGLYNAAKHGLAVEIRVVLHKQTAPNLLPLMQFIYRNLPFVRQVALMGLENMGYVKKNWELLWIDPADYGDDLLEAVTFLFNRRIRTSIYNLPLCVLPRALWSFARKSISDYKNIYLDDCLNCCVKPHCAGLFQSSQDRHSRQIRAID